MYVVKVIIIVVCVGLHWGIVELLSTLIVTSFKASITEMNSTVQYSFQTSDRSGGMLLKSRVHAIIVQGYLYNPQDYMYVSLENA